MVKALGRAFRWRKLLETGAHAIVDDRAVPSRSTPFYVRQFRRFTLLAPEIVEVIHEVGSRPR